MVKRILLVDDEIKLLEILRGSLQMKGFQVYTAASGEEVRTLLSKIPIDIVFLDIMLPDTTGLDLLEEFSLRYPDKIYIMMTAVANVQSAVTAVKAGAFDYLVKPAKLDEILLTISKAIEWQDIKHENNKLRSELRNVESSFGSLGESVGMKHLFPLIQRVSGTDASILLGGESGTGKSMIALLIHKLSDRNQAPFVAVNCAAIPDQLLESELFGYEKGAFTGATSNHKGKFEAAHGGTIFLDEIAEIKPALQAKLLQVTQEKTLMRLGSNDVKEVNVRIIAATNKPLKHLVETGTFREDLYYRLNIVDIEIPPLRERKEDIPLLVETFLDRHRQKNGVAYRLNRGVLDILVAYSWPGNIRELENAIERAVALCQNGEIALLDFPRDVRRQSVEPDDPQRPLFDRDKSLPDQMEEIEKNFILWALNQTEGQAAAAARILGITKQSLSYKLHKFGIGHV